MRTASISFEMAKRFHVDNLETKSKALLELEKGKSNKKWRNHLASRLIRFRTGKPPTEYDDYTVIPVVKLFFVIYYFCCCCQFLYEYRRKNGKNTNKRF